MSIPFEPMRSLIYVHCAKEKYRHKLQHWLYYHHVPESMGQFEPYVSKYTYYWVLPVPEDGERFGTRNHNVTEHYWLVNPLDPRLKIRALAEYFPPEALVWQGHLPDKPEVLDGGLFKGDDARSSGKEGIDGTIPFVWVFVPMWWEEDFKGQARTLQDGCNYRWQFEEVFPVFKDMPQVNRILTSGILRHDDTIALPKERRHPDTEIQTQEQNTFVFYATMYGHFGKM